MKAGPWPERIGCHGTIAVPPADRTDNYPVHGLGASEVIVLLDDDPLVHTAHRAGRSEDWWTCVYHRDHLDWNPTPEEDTDG